MVCDIVYQRSVVTCTISTIVQKIQMLVLHLVGNRIAQTYTFQHSNSVS